MTRYGAGQDTEALVERSLDERLDAFRRSRDDCAEDPSPEAVHEVRIATRRLRAALTLFDPLLILPDGVAPRVLRRVERRFGRVRDLDVVGASLRSAATAEVSPARTAGYADLGATVDAARSEARKRAKAELARQRLRRLTSDLRSWLEDPAFTPVATLPIALLVPDLLLPLLSRTLLEPGWQVAEPPDPDARTAAPLHAIRRRLKQLRYAIECVTDWYGAPVESWLDELHAMQDALGEWHDAGLLLERLKDHEASSSLRPVFLARARAALAPWPAWRLRYLDPEVRAGFRHLLGGCPPGSLDAVPGEARRRDTQALRRRRASTPAPLPGI